MMPSSKFPLNRTLLAALLLVGLACCNRGQKAPETAQPAPPSDPVAGAQALAQKTPSFENFTALGLAYSNAGKHEEALATFQRTLEINPAAPLAENNICAELNALSRWELAIQHCR